MSCHSQLHHSAQSAHSRPATVRQVIDYFISRKSSTALLNGCWYKTVEIEREQVGSFTDKMFLLFWKPQQRKCLAVTGPPLSSIWFTVEVFVLRSQTLNIPVPIILWLHLVITLLGVVPGEGYFTAELWWFWVCFCSGISSGRNSSVCLCLWI